MTALPAETQRAVERAVERVRADLGRSGYSRSWEPFSADLRTILTALSELQAREAAARNAGLILLNIVDEIDVYQKRPESGDWGVECACCMGELFQGDRPDIDTARTALSHTTPTQEA